MSLGHKTPFHQKGIHPVFSDIFNSLWPNDAIWQHRSRSTLVQVMAWCLHAWRHQAITWTNVDWSSAKSNDIHIRAISQEMPQPPITEIRLKITYLKVHSDFPGANELKNSTSQQSCYFCGVATVSVTHILHILLEWQWAMLPMYNQWLTHWPLGDFNLILGR